MTEKTCMICLSEPRFETSLNKCKRKFGVSLHVFCFVCIEKWFRENNFCPYCKIVSQFIYCKSSKTRFNVHELIQQRLSIFKKSEEKINRYICLNLYLNERKALQHSIDNCNKQITETNKIPDKTYLMLRKNEIMWRSDSCLLILKGNHNWDSFLLKSWLPLNGLISIEKFVNEKFDYLMANVYENGIFNEETILTLINSKLDDTIEKINLQIYSENFYNQNCYKNF